MGKIRIALLTTLLCSSSIVNAATLKFTYTSNTDGELGYFTVDEDTFKSHIGEPYSGYLDNQYIDDLSFSYKGATWTKSNIDLTAQTIFQYVGGNPLPVVQGGSGALASSPEYFWGIVLFGGGIAYFADTEVQGKWSTSITTVPEPTSAVLFAFALPLLAIAARQKHLQR